MEKLKEYKLNQKALKSAIANNKLEGHEVTEDMIRRLEKALNDNPEMDRRKIVELILKEDSIIKSDNL